MLTIAPVNDAPVVSPIAATLLEDGQITLNLLDRISDADGDPLSVTIGNPQHGQVLNNGDGSYTYTPDADYNGEDSFSYSASDGILDSGLAIVRLTITAVNDAPVVQDDSATLDEDHSIQLAIMANDHDVDSDSPSLIIVSQPAHGTLAVNADNSVSYTPLANWSGEDSFSYQLNDGDPATLLGTGLDSNLASVRLIVNPVADAPTLVLSEVPGAGRELFRTGWESVDNRNSASTLLEQAELEGWVAVTRFEQPQDDPDDRKDDHHDKHNDQHNDHGRFEIWSSGDKMVTAQGKPKLVTAADGNGSNWLELGSAKGNAHQTLGLERRIETVAGAGYTLSLDLAGHLGYSSDATRIGIYLDGVQIGSDDSTSPVAKLNWQTRVFHFTGQGGVQTLRIVGEGGQHNHKGKGGMMLDNIALTETLPTNTGFEHRPEQNPTDAAIPLSVIGVALKDTDSSETLTLSIHAIPDGATLSDGTHSFTSALDHATADLTGWNPSQLTLTPPQNFNGPFALKIIATATEQANPSQARTEADLQVTVLPVNDAPLAGDASYTLNKDGSLVIDFAGLINDADGDLLSLSFTDPKKGKLTQNTDGTYTYTPKHGFTGTETFSYTVSDGKLDTTARITVTVLPEKDHDEDEDKDHHGNGRRREQNSHPSDHDRSAKLILHSVYPTAPEQRSDVGYAARTLMPSLAAPEQHSSRTSRSTASRIDWTGQAPDLGELKQETWVAEMMTIQPKEQSLAEQTGLVVRMK
jgi:hypothetical protein